MLKNKDFTDLFSVPGQTATTISRHTPTTPPPPPLIVDDVQDYSEYLDYGNSPVLFKTLSIHRRQLDLKFGQARCAESRTGFRACFPFGTQLISAARDADASLGLVARRRRRVR